MSDIDTHIELDFQRDSKPGVGTLTATLDGEILAAERLDVLKPKQRKAFIERLREGRPGIDDAAADEISSQLLKYAGDSAAAPKKNGRHTLTADEAKQLDAQLQSEGTSELDVSRIVRPELFHTAVVSAITVPVVRNQFGGRGITGQWVTYLRWHADGRRECRGLSDTIELPEGLRLYIHPAPGEPSVTMRPGWTGRSRREWLTGKLAPNPADVFRRLCERFAWFLDFDPESAPGVTTTLALWVLLSYAYPAWTTVPYLAIGGPLGSGKSTVFRVLSRLVFRPLESSSMTAPCLFRTLGDCGGVLLLDEAERLRDGSPESSELRAILLSGYKTGSPARRLDKGSDGSFKPLTFDVYGPKALACIAPLPEALASRCLRLTMFRADASSPKPRRRLDADPKSWQRLSDDLHALALEHGSTWLRLAANAGACPATFGGRDFELWQPLFALAAWLDEAGADGLVAVLTDHATRATDAARDDGVPDADETLLRIVAEHVLGGTAATLKAGGVLAAACERDSATFGPKEKPRWAAKRVGNVLRKYGVTTRRGTGNVGRTFSTVTIADLRRVEQAYAFEFGLPTEDVSQVSPCIADAASLLHGVEPITRMP